MAIAVADVVLWRRGRAEVSALALAATVSSWILLGAGAGGGYTAVSLSCNVLLLLLTVLFAWSKAARLLNRPLPPVPDLQPAVEGFTSLLHSGLTDLSAAFRRVALGDPDSGGLFCRVALCLAAALTVPALYQRCSMERYARLACLNLYRYELVYQSFSLRCYLSARDYLIELLKEP
jgi:hypothetical protein